EFVADALIFTQRAIISRSGLQVLSVTIRYEVDFDKIFEHMIKVGKLLHQILASESIQCFVVNANLHLSRWCTGLGTNFRFRILSIECLINGKDFYKEHFL